MIYCRDAEANVMIDMGIAHRSVVARFAYPEAHTRDTYSTTAKKNEKIRKSIRSTH